MVPVDYYVLYENNVAFFNTPGLTAGLSGKADGTYTYKVQACNSVGCSAFTADFVVSVLFLPGTPGSFSVPPTSGPNYAVSWSAGTGRSDSYDLGESTDGVSWPTTYTQAGTAKAFSGKPSGSKFWYRVRACNTSGCSAYTAAKSVDVFSLTTISEQPPPPFVPPAQEWVGTMPGTPSTEGGAAVYRIPIEVAPGRAGMQPDVALTYSSRNGNGVAGVGWSISGTSSIYRCPRTLVQDGGNRPLLHDLSDRLCFDGQRLVGSAGTYGSSGSEYRTEIDQFARIILRGGNTSTWGSYFEVEHKSGRISQFETVPVSVGSGAPQVWRLAREFDRQENCIAYDYTAFVYRGAFPEAVLKTITYTGTRSGNQCTTSAAARSVVFDYTDRPDRRTTYRFGMGSPATARLAAISTKVGTQAVRRYELTYKISMATQRSLLQAVTLCAGGACGTEKLPLTSFTYQEDPPSFDFSQLQFNGQTLNADWRAAMASDFDGDGRNEHVYDFFNPADQTRTRYLELSKCTTTFSPLDPTLGLQLNM
jgi:hypothetical protein